MDFLLYWLARGVVEVIAGMPLKGAARLGRALGWIAWTLDARHRKVALGNLQLALSDELGQEELREIARENFRRIGENYCCAIKTAMMTDASVLERLEIVGLDHLREAARSGQNVVVAIGHFGNFELYTRLKGCIPDYTFATTYRALRQKSLTRLMQDLRGRSGCLFFERRSEAEGLKMALNKGRLMLGLLADQHAGRGGVLAPFFGLECSTTPAPAVLALRYEARLFTAVCHRVSLARWRIEMHGEIPLRATDGRTRSSLEVMTEVNERLEAAVRRDPANWFWVHKRWKPVPQRKPQPAGSDAAV